MNRTAVTIGGIVFTIPMPGEGYSAAQLRGVREARAARQLDNSCANCGHDLDDHDRTQRSTCEREHADYLSGAA